MNGLERDWAITNIEANGDRVDCVHHWIIEPPKGKTSRGNCKSCGTKRLFLNYCLDALLTNMSDADTHKIARMPRRKQSSGGMLEADLTAPDMQPLDLQDQVRFTRKIVGTRI